MRENLRNCRLQREYTQLELSKQLGISERYYQAIEAGTRKGDVYVWEKLTLILDMPLHYLLVQVDSTAKRTPPR